MANRHVILNVPPLYIFMLLRVWKISLREILQVSLAPANAPNLFFKGFTEFLRKDGRRIEVARSAERRPPDGPQSPNRYIYTDPISGNPTRAAEEAPATIRIPDHRSDRGHTRHGSHPDRGSVRAMRGIYPPLPPAVDSWSFLQSSL